MIQNYPQLPSGYQLGELICWRLLKSSAESYLTVKIFHMEKLRDFWWRWLLFWESQTGELAAGSTCGVLFLQIAQVIKQSCTAANYSKETEILNY